MSNDQSQKLLGHLYQIVPQKKSATEISKEVFSNAPINEPLSELLREGYIYQWKNEAEDKTPSPAQEQYGITVKGILFFGKFSTSKKPDLPVQPIAASLAEKTAIPEETNIETAPEENITFKRVLPVIIFIAFAIALVWFIIRIKK